MSSGAEIYYEPSGCNCNGTSYTKQDINTAASRALELASQGQTLGKYNPRPLSSPQEDLISLLTYHRPRQV